MTVPTLYNSTLQAFSLMLRNIEDVFHQNTAFHSVKSLFQVIGTHVDSITLVSIVHDGFHVGKDGVSERRLLAICCLELVRHSLHL